jgi:hypothetical protein
MMIIRDNWDKYLTKNKPNSLNITAKDVLKTSPRKFTHYIKTHYPSDSSSHEYCSTIDEKTFTDNIINNAHFYIKRIFWKVTFPR